MNNFPKELSHDPFVYGDCDKLEIKIEVNNKLKKTTIYKLIHFNGELYIARKSFNHAPKNRHGLNSVGKWRWMPKFERSEKKLAKINALPDAELV